MKKMLIILVILSGLTFAQSESRLDPAPAGQGIQEVITTETATTSEETLAPAACLGGGGIMSFLPMIAIIGIFYFLMIRPQQKQSKMLRQMREAFSMNDRVVTSGGIHGIITNIKGDIVTVKIADGVKIDVDRNSLQLQGAEGESCAVTK
jgi:preprotein translocase subunit YajC